MDQITLNLFLNKWKYQFPKLENENPFYLLEYYIPIFSTEKIVNNRISFVFIYLDGFEAAQNQK